MRSNYLSCFLSCQNVNSTEQKTQTFFSFNKFSNITLKLPKFRPKPQHKKEIQLEQPKKHHFILKKKGIFTNIFSTHQVWSYEYQSPNHRTKKKKPKEKEKIGNLEESDWEEWESEELRCLRRRFVWDRDFLRIFSDSLSLSRRLRCRRRRWEEDDASDVDESEEFEDNEDDVAAIVRAWEKEGACCVIRSFISFL